MKGGGEEGGRGGGEKETEGGLGLSYWRGDVGPIFFCAVACKLLRTANYRRSVLKLPFPTITAKQRKGRDTHLPLLLFSIQLSIQGPSREWDFIVYSKQGRRMLEHDARMYIPFNCFQPSFNSVRETFEIAHH
jgi:hypothetical protein